MVDIQRMVEWQIDREWQIDIRRQIYRGWQIDGDKGRQIKVGRQVEDDRWTMVDRQTIEYIQMVVDGQRMVDRTVWMIGRDNDRQTEVDKQINQIDRG